MCWLVDNWNGNLLFLKPGDMRQQPVCLHYRLYHNEVEKHEYLVSIGKYRSELFFAVVTFGLQSELYRSYIKTRSKETDSIGMRSVYPVNHFQW